MPKQTRLTERTGRCKIALARFVVLAWLGLLLALPAGAQTYVKWDQPPDPAQPDNLFLGWDEESICWELGHTVADDFVCDTDDPVTHVRWWGSFQGWKQPYPLPPDEMPLHFHFLFWTDVPADPTDPNSFSHPGIVIHEIVPPDYSYSCQFAGWEYDPRTGEYLACFVFDQELEQWEWFFQDPTGDPTIYWISVIACYY